MFRKIIRQSERIGKSVNLSRITNLRSRSFNSNSNSQADWSRGEASFARRAFEVFLPRAFANLVGFSAAWLAVYRLQNVMGVRKEERELDEHLMLKQHYSREIAKNLEDESRARKRETREAAKESREEKEH